MAKVGPAGRAARAGRRRSAAAGADRSGPSIHPRLLELVRAHRSTLIFVNSRRLAERLAAALNELAGEPLVRAHHGSLARAQRTEIEDLLKAGRLRALVATSSLELGIDMGAIDLVVQIEAPPSVASGLQRIGRAGPPRRRDQRGRDLPEVPRRPAGLRGGHRRDDQGAVEPSRYPRNPLDVLAQQIVAMTAMDHWSVDDLYAAVRGAAPFAELSRARVRGRARHAVGPLSLRRVRRAAAARHLGPRQRHGGGPRRAPSAWPSPTPARFPIAASTACSSPTAARDGARVGELDEEMVFEARAGETFLLGASTWRIEEITHDRVLVSPAPGEPGKMPFWKGDGPGRPIELGQAIGKLTRELRQAPPGGRGGAADARARPRRAAPPRTCCSTSTTSSAPPASCPTTAPSSSSARSDEIGDWRLSVLSPFGSRVHAPWAMAVTAQLRDERGLDAEVMWSDDGFVVRLPEGDAPLDPALLVPDPDEVERLVVRAARARRRCSRRASARPPAGRCCCRSGGPARARRCGSSASAPPTCWRSRRGSARSRSSSRPTASACATSSTCRRSSSC